ncbi:MAG: histone deacetylase family protein, partial [Pseudomonadales bacterium]|nr:histone deacetylase family protein [Pseudomonadales bacterium]
AVDAALTAGRSLRNGARFSQSMVRPPGHHAERKHFGGFCYLNSSAIAAQFLSRVGTVAMLDVDYHHGNGQQDIFWHRQDVLTVSIHANPRVAYPYFSGYAEEDGEGRGKGYNVNFPLPEKLDGEQYRRTLKKAVSLIHDYQPDVIVVPLGFDPARNDPTGSWSLDSADFFANGQMIAKLGRPTLFVQEGGYNLETLSDHARAFFSGVLYE